MNAMLTTRVRRNESGDAVLQMKVKGAWEDILGTDTYGQLELVEDWLSGTMPSKREEIMREFYAWEKET